VNVRAEPTVDSDVVAIASDGQIVTLRIASVDTVYDADGVTRWWPITIDGVDGWVSGFFLTSSADVSDPSSSATTFAAGSYVQANTGDGDGVNIRSQGSPGAETVGTLADGEVAQVVEGPVSFEASTTGWYQITTGALTGFVDGDLVIATTAPAEPAPGATEPAATATPTTPAAPTAPAEPVAGEFTAGDYVAVRSVSGAGVNVRESATMTSAIVGFRADNSILRVTDGPVVDEEGDAWYRVSDGDLTGWVVANLLISSVAPTDGTDGTAEQPTVTPVTPVTPVATTPAEPSSVLSYPLTDYRRTQGFGCSSLGFYPFDPDFGCNIHDGLDLAAPSGTPLLAAASGTVVTAGWCDCGLGYYVEIDHGDGLHTLYGHMAEQPFVSAGQQVNRGDVIGPVGSTGISTGPHVHFMVRVNGVAQDPENYLP
jgi:murein DD-endopeptidase MepM/ murein hydrolase activator NlpD